MAVMGLVSLLWFGAVVLAVAGIAWLHDYRLREVLEERVPEGGTARRPASCYWRAAAGVAARLRLRPDQTMERRLRGAGMSPVLKSEDLKGAKVLGMLVGFGVSFLSIPIFFPLVFFGIMGMMLLYLGPEIWLDRAIRRRQRRIDVEVGEAIDVVSVSVEAGAGLDRSLQLYTVHFSGPLAEELRLFHNDLLNGMPRRDAYAALRSRNSSEELSKLVRALSQSEELGVPVAQAIRQLAHDARLERSQKARELAAKASPKITLITTFLLAPASALFILGSLILNMIFNPHFAFGRIFGGGG